MNTLKKVAGKITYANVVSTLCLFLVLGGGAAYAASHLPKNSVGAKQIRKGAIGPSKLSKETIKTLAGDRGPAGPKGATGAAGAQGQAGAPGAPGAPGGAKAWVDVSHTGQIIRSFGGITVTKLPGLTGKYCIAAGGYTTGNSVGIASGDWSDEENNNYTIIQVANGPASNECAPGQFEIIASDSYNGEYMDAGFTFMIP